MKKIICLLLSVAAAAHFTVSADSWANYRIMLDPGHGGSDPGASGPQAPHEATLCLRAALSLSSKLSSLGAPYKLTRTDNSTLSLSARRNMSVSYDPYIFCSIHLNAYNGTANGIETWYYWSTGNSYTLAQKVQAQLVSQLGRVNRGVKQNGWTVITGSSSVPAILTEGLFVDNYTEWSMICNEGSDGFNRWVNGHLYGFYDHLVRFNSNITNPRNGTGSSSGTSTPTPTPDPSVSVNNSSWSYSCEAGETAIATFSVTKANTSSDVTVTSSNSVFYVSKVTQHSTGAWFDLKFMPTAAGSYSGTITVKAGSASTTMSVKGTATTPAPKEMLLDIDNWSFKSKVGESDIKTFTCTVPNSTSPTVTVSSNNSAFVLSKLTSKSDGAWFDITYKPTVSGTQTGVITVSAAGFTKTISVTGNATATPVYFKEKWNFSEKNKTSTFRQWDATKVRNMTYGAGKLYLVYEQENIKVVNAQTGEDLGNLNKVGLGGGTVPVADVKICDGKLVASNIAIAANDEPLRVYVWDDDQSNPRLLLETTDFGDAARLGDCIGWGGTWTDGRIVFATDNGSQTKLYTYTVKNGAITSTTPTVTPLVNADGSYFKASASTRPYPQSGGGYWVSGQNCPTTFFGEDGKRQYCLDQDVDWGNAFAWFNWNGQRYGVYTTYEPFEGDSLSSQTDEQKAKNYTKGRFRLFSYDGSWEDTSDIYDYPSWGLSDVNQNTGCTSNVICSTTEGSVEVWLLIANQGIAYYVNQGGVTPSYGLEPVESLKPVIIPSASIVNVTSTNGVEASTDFTIHGTRLAGDINLQLTGADADRFSISSSVVEKDAEFKTITINYVSSATASHEAALIATSQDADPVTVNLTAQSKESEMISDNINALSQRWIYSQNLGNLAAASWFSADASKPTRDIALANWKIYVLNSKAWNEEPEINILDAYSGNHRGALNLTGVTGGENSLSSIAALGGMVIGSNSARCAGFNNGDSREVTTDVLKVYRWADDSSAPELWLEDPTHGETHVGEIMSVWGNMTDGKVMFCDGARVLVYKVTNGSINREPRVIELMSDDQPWNAGNMKGVNGISMLDDGSFWVTGKDCYPSLFDAYGNLIEAIDADGFGGSLHGTTTTIFSVGEKTYMAGATYLGESLQTHSLSAGAMNVVDITDNATFAETKCIYPAQGLGTTINDTFQTRVLSENSTDGERVNLWVMVPMQGIAFYKFDSSDSSLTGIETVSVSQVCRESEWYDLQGLRIDPDHLVPGIYIRIKDGVATKTAVH